MNRTVRLGACLCAGFLILPAAVGEEYSWQVSASYRDEDAPSATQADLRLVRATYYLTPVDDGAGPFELAPFLDRSSYLAVGTGRTSLRESAPLVVFESDLGEPGWYPDGVVDEFGRPSPTSIVPTTSGVDVAQYMLEGRFVWRDSGWYVGAHAQRGDGDGLPPATFGQMTMELRQSGLVGGRYLGPRTTVEVGFGSETTSQEMDLDLFGLIPALGPPGFPVFTDIPAISPFAIRNVTETDADDTRLSVRHVGDLGNSTFEISAGVRSSRWETLSSVNLPEDLNLPFDPTDPSGTLTGGIIGILPPADVYLSGREREVSLSGALFPVDALGVRLTATTLDDDDLGRSDTLSLSANWFFARNAALNVELTRSSYDLSFIPGTDAFGVSLLGRF